MRHVGCSVPVLPASLDMYRVLALLTSGGTRGNFHFSLCVNLCSTAFHKNGDQSWSKRFWVIPGRTPQVLGLLGRGVSLRLSWAHRVRWWCLHSVRGLDPASLAVGPMVVSFIEEGELSICLQRDLVPRKPVGSPPALVKS